MKIGIDIDGVLTDIERWQLDYGSKYFYKFGKSIEDYKAYETLKNLGYEVYDLGAFSSLDLEKE